MLGLGGTEKASVAGKMRAGSRHLPPQERNLRSSFSNRRRFDDAAGDRLPKAVPKCCDGLEASNQVRGTEVWLGL